MFRGPAPALGAQIGRPGAQEEAGQHPAPNGDKDPAPVGGKPQVAAQQGHQGNGQDGVGGDLEVEIEEGVEENGQQARRSAEDEGESVAATAAAQVGLGDNAN